MRRICMIEVFLHCPDCGRKQKYVDQPKDGYIHCQCSRCDTRFAVDILSIEMGDEDYE
jgi:transcription elongation factor Elf1